MFISTLTLKSLSPTFTHWNKLKPDLVKAGCNKNNITIKLTTTYLFTSLKYVLNVKCMIIHMMLYTNINISGSKAIRNILNMVAFGANAFISLSWMKQSSDTNDSDDEPIILAGENTSFTVSGKLASKASTVETTCK